MKTNTQSNLLIGLLGGVAALLVAGHLGLPQAQAGVSERADKYQLIAAEIVGSGDGVYVIDNSNGIIALFAWNTAQKRIEPKNIRFLSDMLIDSPATR
jgi:hypothetical protein